MSEETTVGTIVGILKMDDSPWKRAIDEAIAKNKELGRSNPNIKIGVDAATAMARLAEVDAAIKVAGKEKLEIRPDVQSGKALAEMAKIKADALSISVAFSRAQH